MSRTGDFKVRTKNSQPTWKTVTASKLSRCSDEFSGCFEFAFETTLNVCINVCKIFCLPLKWRCQWSHFSGLLDYNTRYSSRWSEIHNDYNLPIQSRWRSWRTIWMSRLPNFLHAALTTMTCDLISRSFKVRTKNSQPTWKTVMALKLSRRRDNFKDASNLQPKLL